MQFEISGDSTPLAKAITEAMKSGQAIAKKGGEVAGSKFGKEFGSQVKNAVMNVLGAGAIIGAFRSQITNAARLTQEAVRNGLGVEAWQELQRAAELVGMTVEELREAAPQVGEEFTAMMNAIRQGGGILDAQTVETLALAGDSLREASVNLAPAMAMAVNAANWLLNGARGSTEWLVGASNYLEGLGESRTRGDTSRMEAGREMMNEAFQPRQSPTTARQAASTVRQAILNRREAERERRNEITRSFESLGTAGAERDLGLVGGMIPGMNSELVEQMRRAVSRLESIDQNLR
jgi:hypothetical protein